MKNFLITIVLLLSAMAVQAQTSPAAKKEVADIRKQYAEAKQEMEALDKKPYSAAAIMRRALVRPKK